MTLELSPDEFERLVVSELDELPDDMVDGLENLVFVTEDRPEDGSLDLLGLYQGVALTDRDRYGFGELPDRIVLYREPLLSIRRGTALATAMEARGFGGRMPRSTARVSRLHAADGILVLAAVLVGGIAVGVAVVTGWWHPVIG